MSENVTNTASLDLLAPIADEHPTGVSLRYELVYQQIGEARREEDPTLPQGAWERPLKRADWIRVEQLCSDALTTRTKDVQIAAWLAEAWLHLRGLDGFAQGLNLVESLCKMYWDEIYPQIEEDDIEYRLAPFIWIDTNLSLALRRAVPIVEDVSETFEAHLTMSDWTRALHLEDVALKDPKALPASDRAKTPTRADFSSKAVLTSETFFRGLSAGMSRSEAAVAQLERLMTEKLHDDSPGLAQLRGALQEMRKVVQDLGGARAVPPPGQTEAGLARRAKEGPSAPVTLKGNEMADRENEIGQSASASASGPITSREEAFRRLDEAADYLMRTEPHSPCPYLVKRAVAWGRMPLAELLQELVRGEGELQELFGLLGMHQQQPSEPS